MHNTPKVAVVVIVRKDGKVLLGKRKNILGHGMWGFAGGHLEFGETWEECARREVMEEAGIEIHNVTFAAVRNVIFEKEQKHYVNIYMIADYKSGEVIVCEPEKLEAWDWFDWSSLPTPLYSPIDDLMENGFNPFTY